MIVDLSIDFDFFVREDPMWDFGHSEIEDQRALFTYMAWSWRYQQTDLYRETDLAKHADFQPSQIVSELASRGIDLSRVSTVGYADSHALAYPFFTHRKKVADRIISLDAHHDVYGPPTAKPNCGNWVHHVRNASPKTEIEWIWPQWKAEWIADEVPKGGLPIPMRSWGLVQETPPVKIRDIMVCRSGAWVPPHLDEAFRDMLLALCVAARTSRPLEAFYERKAPTLEEADAQRAEYTAQWAAVRATMPPPAPLRLGDLTPTMESLEEASVSEPA